MTRPGCGTMIRLVTLVLVFSSIEAAARASDFQQLAERIVGPDQGVFVEAEDGRVLAAVHAERASHPASLAKIAGTLAFLSVLGPDHRFATRILQAGETSGSRLEGHLVIEGSGDPYLVSESALLVASELTARGVGDIRGGVRFRGPLFFNWSDGGAEDAFIETLSGVVGEEAFAAARDLDPRLIDRDRADIRIQIGEGERSAEEPELLFVYRSPPLLRVLKELNAYSNNVFEPASRLIGGAAAVQRLARERLPPDRRAEVVLDNAAGLGRRNRMSPAAVVALVGALEDQLALGGHRLSDVLPVAGVDHGTLEARFAVAELRDLVVAKTGTIASRQISALAGVVSTQDHGRVRFAILNTDVPVLEARRRQDAFLRELVEVSGGRQLGYRAIERGALYEAIIE